MKNTITHRSICIFCFVVLLSGGGCSLLDVPPPLSQVLLAPVPPPRPETAGPSTGMQLVVAEPVADGVASSDRISAVFNGYEVRFLAGVRWTAPAPRLLQRLFVESLYGSGLFAGVGEAGGAMRSDLRLSTDVRRFGLRYREAKTPVVEAAFTFRLVDARSGSVLGTLSLRDEENTAEDSVSHYMLAFNTMMSRVLGALNAWTAKTVAGFGETEQGSGPGTR